jgi:phosphate starvation-inducible PhoH-like protein
MFKNFNSLSIINFKKFSILNMKKKQSSNLNIYNPKSENQKKYVSFLDDNKYKIIVSLGPAGTGKTLFACQKAILKLKTDELNKIIITRPVVSVEEEIGFLPGNLIKKMDPWTKPIFDIFLEFFSKTELDYMLLINKIEICPLAYMRGRTFKNAYIIADEMQNSSPNQMKMLMTRLGDNSRLIVTGDLRQSDIKIENGLNDFINKFNIYNKSYNDTSISVVNFENEDIERSEIVKQIIDIYDFDSKKIVKKSVYTPTTSVQFSVPNFTSNKNNSSSPFKPNYLYYNDAALIPKAHITHNYDIFFEGREF